jgi:hypothetical protein
MVDRQHSKIHNHIHKTVLLDWASWIQFTLSYPLSLALISIFTLISQVVSSTWIFPPTKLYAFHIIPTQNYMLSHLSQLDLVTLVTSAKSGNFVAPDYAFFFIFLLFLSPSSYIHSSLFTYILRLCSFLWCQISFTHIQHNR